MTRQCFVSMTVCKKNGEFISVKYYLLVVALIASCFVVTACNSHLSGVESGELRQRAYRCDIETNLTQAEIQVCKNIQRECQRREDAGQFDC
ncbi:MAG: hypothetical protein ACI9EX_000720 [Oleispira sp.]|jgi:hypothetical protein